MSKPDSITIDDVKYVRADSVGQVATDLNGMPYVICRTYSAGVFAGYLESRDAASLSQLAEEGSSKPNACKFPQEVSKIELLQVIEILTVTKKAQEFIASVKAWKQ